MSEAFTGGCACGALRYEIDAEPIFQNDLPMTGLSRNPLPTTPGGTTPAPVDTRTFQPMNNH